MNAAKCPVCGWDLKDGAVQVNVNGKRVRVCCEDCANKLKAEPDK